jgi:hypothetical protein
LDIINGMARGTRWALAGRRRGLDLAPLASGHPLAPADGRQHLQGHTSNIDQPFKFLTPGAVIAVVTWILASLGFSFYVAHFGNYGATYGSLGGIVILLFYFFISAAVLLFGAEINATILPASEKQAGDGAALRTT